MQAMRVLIGDDEPDAAHVLSMMVESLGHDVAGIAFDGRDAVAQAEALDPNLLFLNFKMPRLDGLAATRAIMMRRPLPIILVTGSQDADLIQGAVEAGVMGYLVKPVDRKELAPSIAVAMARFRDLVALGKKWTLEGGR